jgi:hypothetical protein
MLGTCRGFTLLVCVAWLGGCGGSTFQGDDADGGAGSGGSPSGGSPSGGGSGVSGTGGGPGSGGVSGSGGSAPCLDIPCPDVDCVTGSHQEARPGECCPSCVPDKSPHPSCATVVCEPPPSSCRPDYVVGRAPGACCTSCVPIGTATPPPECQLLDCATPPLCPAGYYNAPPSLDCCGRCMPDPLYCRENRDCVIADRPRSCCGCPELISVREYEEDACWSDVAAPRPIPSSCYPEAVCGAICGACALPFGAYCGTDNRCGVVE